MADTNREIDNVTGIETTGHEWDGIKELNNPLPMWWNWTWIATIVWSIIYMILYPAWPLVSDYTRGVLGHSDRAELAETMAELDQTRQAAAKAAGADLQDFANKTAEELYHNAATREIGTRAGRAAYNVNCSQCHGNNATGFVSYPNLIDDDWIWGGSLDDVVQTIKYGIRSDHDDARVGDMPGFLTDETLDKGQVEAVTEYVLKLAKQDHNAKLAAQGSAIYKENCADCHRGGGKGNVELGAPNLTDGIWLYGADRAEIVKSISFGRAGVMPNWNDKLSEATIKQIAIWLRAEAGGQ